MRVNVLLVGQTPPPVNGQTIMIQELLDGKYNTIQFHYVRMNFSRAIDEVGSFQMRKLSVLLLILGNIVMVRWKSRPSVLYYPPAGPNFIPVIRDLILLISTRWMFRYTVFHFHAAGLPEIYPRLPRILRPFYRMAYQNADLAIFTTQSTSSAGAALSAKAVTVIPCGVPDSTGGTEIDGGAGRDLIRILYMGILCEGKGLLTLIEACSLLCDSGMSFRVVCAGAYDSESFRRKTADLVERKGMTQIFDFPGVLSGESKWSAFRETDIFCFPSHYHAESFGVVLIEAMSFGLPIVTTNWRGIPDVVASSGGAFVVQPKMPDLIAEKLATLMRNGELRKTMGKKNRAFFCENYTVEKYRSRMEEALASVAKH